MHVSVKFKTSGPKSFGPRDVREVEAGKVYQMPETQVQRYPKDAIEVVKGTKKVPATGPAKKASKSKGNGSQKKAAKKKASKKKAGKKKAAKG